MTVSDWLQQATTALSQAGITTARLDCLVLLEDCTAQDRSHLLAHPEQVLDPSQLAQLQQQLNQRVKHIPLAYIRGFSEFYGRKFKVSPAVLVPRPETEAMIDLLKKLPVKHLPKGSIADVGTGSGAIAITAALELPHLSVIATDVNNHCLDIAQQNSKAHKVELTFLSGDLLMPLRSHSVNVVLANLPYVPNNHSLNRAAMNEPKQAIFGGPDGLDVYRQLFNQISSLPQRPTYILTEALPFQHALLIKIAQTAQYKIDQTEDFIQLFRDAAASSP